MSTKKRKLSKESRKKIIIAFVAVCAIALIAEAGLLIHTFSKKKPAGKPESEPTLTEEPQVSGSPSPTPAPETYSVWKLAKSFIIDGNNEDVLMYEYLYDELGRESGYISYETDGVTVIETYESTYLPDGSRIEEVWMEDKNGKLLESYYYPPAVDLWNETFGLAKIDRCEKDESGRITSLRTLMDWDDPRMDHAPVEWTFQDGRVTGFYYLNEDGSIMQPWEILYDDSGRVTKVVAYYSERGGDIAETIVIAYDGDSVTVTKTSGVGEYALMEYKNGYLMHDETSKTLGPGVFTKWTQTYIWPKGNWPEFMRFSICGREAYYTDEDGEKKQNDAEKDSEGQPVVSTDYLSDGSVLSVAKYYYDFDGMLNRIDHYDSDGTQSTERFEFDEAGNLTYWDEAGIAFRFEWVELKIPVEQK